MKRNKLAAALAFATVAGCGLGAPMAADASTWIVNGTFQDGATVTGFFDFNVYGYIANYDLKTTASGAFAGFEFKPGGGNIAAYATGPGTTSITFFGPTYNGDQLTLLTSLPLTTGFVGNSLTAASNECQNSWSCPGGGGDVRFLNLSLSAIAPTPEPATWAMMLVGFGLMGYSMRRRFNLRSRSEIFAAD